MSTKETGYALEGGASPLEPKVLSRTQMEMEITPEDLTQTGSQIALKVQTPDGLTNDIRLHPQIVLCPKNAVGLLSKAIKEIITLSRQTLNERITGNTIILRNYLKYGGKGYARGARHLRCRKTDRKTGTALLINKVKNLTVVSINI